MCNQVDDASSLTTAPDSIVAWNHALFANILSNVFTMYIIMVIRVRVFVRFFYLSSCRVVELLIYRRTRVCGACVYGTIKKCNVLIIIRYGTYERPRSKKILNITA